MYWFFLIFSLILQAVVISLTYGYQAKKKVESEDGEQDTKMVVDEERQKASDIKKYDRFTTFTKILKQYSGLVLMAQIAYELINNQEFLGAYGWGTQFKDTMKDLNINEQYMGMIGFYEYGTGENKNIAWIFLSPIIFYITTSIMKDHFSDKRDALKAQQEAEKALIDLKMTLKSQSVAEGGFAGKEAEDVKFQITFDYERIRFSVKYLIYQRINQWKLIDILALNFHIVTCFVTVFLCINWQISLFMLFQLLSSIYLCWRISYEMYKYGQQFKYDIQYRGLQGEKLQSIPRNKIKFEEFQKEYITIDEAYQMNKNYKAEASEKLMNIR